MTNRFEVYIKEGLVDPAGDGLLKDIEDLGIRGARDARFIRVTEIDGNISKSNAQRIASQLLADPVSQKFAIGRVKGPLVSDAWLISIKYNHGVTDFVAESTMKGIADMGIKNITAARTSNKVVLRGKLSPAQVENICRKLLANPVIQTFSIENN
jgi:phosphoribosylformylglycinamidine (FGAM) synthase PurS component